MVRKREKWADPTLLEEARRYGKFDVNACLNCGGCTIVCPLTSNGTTFSPRRTIQYVQAGLRDRLQGSLDPWLCYYCGDCSTSCPRETETGESMMTLRRYVTAQYDWTGLSSKFYKSKVWQIGALIGVGLAMLASIILFFYPHRLLEFGHLFELSAVFTVLLLIFIPNILRMHWFTMGRTNPKPSFMAYLTELKTLVLHAVTQLQLRKCKEKGFWLKHLFVVAGYLLTLILTVFVGWFKTYIYPAYHPFKLAGIVIIAVLFVFTAILITDRIRKREESQKFAQLSDWLFPIWLFMMIFTLFLAYISLSLGIKEVGYGFYIVHLVVLSQWALVIVPFSKWTHFLYRPLAIYFHAIKERAIQMQLRREDKLSLEGAKQNVG